jgi:hypothetical protein
MTEELKNKLQQASIMDQIRKNEDAEWDKWMSEIEQRVFQKEIAQVKAKTKEHD